MRKITFFKVLFSSIILISSCSCEEATPHDDSFNLAGFVSDKNAEIEKNFCSQEIRTDLVKDEIKHMNIVLDMSAGLNQGIKATDDVAMKPILRTLLDKSHLYKVASDDEIKNLSFQNDGDAYVFLTDDINFSGAYSKLEPGVEKCTEDLNTPSLMISDFLLDKGNRKRRETKDGSKKYVASVTEHGWVKKSGFEKWLKAGNSIHFFVYKYPKSLAGITFETNIYYCFFIPKNIKFQGTDLFKELKDQCGDGYLLVDPLAVNLSLSNLFDSHTSQNSNNGKFNYNNDEDNYSIFQYPINRYNTDEKYEYLNAPQNLNNNSPWLVDFKIETTDEFLNIKDFGKQIKPPSNEFGDFDCIKTYPVYDFVNIEEKNEQFSFSFDREAKNGFNLDKCQGEPKYFISKTSINIRSLKVNEKFKITAKKLLQCDIYDKEKSNKTRYKFEHKALYNGLIQSLSETKVEEAAIDIISKPYFYKTYSIVSVNPKN